MADSFGFVESVVPAPSRLRLRQAKVTAVASNLDSVTVQIAGDTTTSVSGVKFLNSYSPAVNDAVWLVTDGKDLFIIGALNGVPAGATNANSAPYALAMGQVTIAIAGTANANAAVTYPIGRFSGTGIAPYPMATMISAAGGTQKLIPRALNLNSTGFTMYVYTGDSTTASANITIAWLAILPNSLSSASGA
jgi:hypothetical protein